MQRPLAQIVMQAAACVIKMREHGMLVDTERMHALQLEKVNESAALEHELQSMTGDKYFNPRSPKQVAELLYSKMGIPKRYKRGKLTVTTDDDALMEIGGIIEKEGELVVVDSVFPERTRICLAILGSRRATKLASTYYSLRVDSDGRTHPDWKMSAGAKRKDEDEGGGTDTGRYTCHKPPIQTYPPRARAIFVAPQGRKLAYYDLSQIEFRIMIWESKDKTGTKLLEEGGDIHRNTAAEMFRKSRDAVTAEERFQAKFVNYGLPYGRGPDSLAAQHKLTMQDAQGIFDRHHETFFELWAWLRTCADFARRNKYIENVYHRRRFFIDEPDDERDRKAYNFKPQSTAHDLLMQIHADINAEIPEVDVIADMHDALLIEQPEDFDSSRIIKIFERERLSGLKTPCGVKVASDWGAMGR
jgi:DNA polymerase-1